MRFYFRQKWVSLSYLRFHMFNLIPVFSTGTRQRLGVERRVPQNQVGREHLNPAGLGCGTENNSESNWSGSFMSPLRNAFARATIKIFPLPLPQPHAESVVNDHGYSLEIPPRPTSQLKFKSHAVARFREPGSSSRFCPRARCITSTFKLVRSNRIPACGMWNGE